MPAVVVETVCCRGSSGVKARIAKVQCVGKEKKDKEVRSSIEVLLHLVSWLRLS